MKKNVPYHVSIKGCVVSLMSHNCGSNVLKRLLVNPSWVDLWTLVKDGKFDLGLWNKLTPREKSFMMLLANNMKIENPELHSTNNHEAEQDVERLKLLEGAIIGGNLNKEIVEEANGIIDRLADKQMLYRQTANSLKKRFAKAYEQTQESFDDVARLRRRI
jgi:hypothetical protein